MQAREAAEALSQGASGGETLRVLGLALHDLCQPLTTLQCRLEMAEMVGTQEALLEAVAMGMAECARLTEAVAQMRGILRRAAAEGDLGASPC